MKIYLEERGEFTRSETFPSFEKLYTKEKVA